MLLNSLQLACVVIQLSDWPLSLSCQAAVPFLCLTVGLTLRATRLPTSSSTVRVRVNGLLVKFMVCVYTAEIDGRQRRLATSHCFHSYMETGTSCCQRILTSLPYVTETRCSLILKNLDVLGAYLGGFIEMSLFNICLIN